MGLRIAGGALALSLLGTGSAFAGRPPQQFQAPREMSAEEVAASKTRARDNIGGYDRGQEEAPQPFPWMALGLGVLTLVVATPFALRYYHSVSSEINATKASNRGRRVAPGSNGLDGS